MGRSRARRGFTLLEALVSMIILAFITVAVAGALSAGLQAGNVAARHSNMDARVRVIFDALTKDIENTYVTAANPFSCFTTQNSVGGESSAGSTILTLSTLNNRIETDPTNGAASQYQSPDSSVVPQSDLGMVRWDLDTGSHKLSRVADRVPGIQTLMSATAGPDDVIDDNVQEVDFNFYDAVQQQWQTTWDVQPIWNASTSGSGSSSGTSSTGTTGSSTGTATATAPTDAPTSTAQQPTSNTNQGQNQYLPQLVQITVILLDQDGTTKSYTTQVPLVMWATLSGESLTTSSSSSSGTGTTGSTGTSGSTGTTGGTGARTGTTAK